MAISFFDLPVLSLNRPEKRLPFDTLGAGRPLFLLGDLLDIPIVMILFKHMKLWFIKCSHRIIYTDMASTSRSS